MYLTKCCNVWRTLKIGDILARVDEGLDGSFHKYYGKVLTPEERKRINQMCHNAYKVDLEDIMEELLVCAQTGSEVTELTAEQVDFINHICAGCEMDKLGDGILKLQQKVNSYWKR